MLRHQQLNNIINNNNNITKIFGTNRFLSLDAKELMRSILFSVNVTEGSRVTIVTSYERNSTHFVRMYNLLRIFKTKVVMTSRELIIDLSLIVSNTFGVIVKACRRVNSAAPPFIIPTEQYDIQLPAFHVVLTRM